MVIILCIYCLATFTDFVPNLDTRSLCGWALVFLFLGFLIVFNLILVMYQSFVASKRQLKLRVIKARNIRNMKQKVEMKKLCTKFIEEQK